MSADMRESLDRALNEMFRESQADLPEKDRCALRTADMCLHKYGGYKCTKVKGHTGDHIAHGTSGAILRWQS